MAARVGVVLSGCGFLDGTEITEAVSILIALDRSGAQIICAAPNIPQAATTNHLSRAAESHNRNVMEESARIARGKVRDLATLKADEIDALIFPGGFGAAKNLCSFASQGPGASVHPEVARIITRMHQAKKPIGLACIAPVLAARVLGQAGANPLLTIGTDKATADAIRSMNARHQDTAPDDICVDETNRLVTTPCYMNNVGPWIVYQGAQKMVEQVLRMAGQR